MRILQLSKETKSNILEDLLKLRCIRGACGCHYRYGAKEW